MPAQGTQVQLMPLLPLHPSSPAECHSNVLHCPYKGLSCRTSPSGNNKNIKRKKHLLICGLSEIESASHVSTLWLNMSNVQESKNCCSLPVQFERHHPSCSRGWWSRKGRSPGRTGSSCSCRSPRELPKRQPTQSNELIKNALYFQLKCTP